MSTDHQEGTGMVPAVDPMMKLLMDTTAELDPELEEYLDEDGMFGLSLRHPLVYEVPYFGRAAWVNHQLEQKRKMLAQAVASKNWSEYIWLHERPYRSNALQHLLLDNAIEDDAEYWSLVKVVWTDTENLRQWGPSISVLLEADRPGRSEHLMDEAEQEALDALPDPVTVYRGYRGRVGGRGWSWTTDYEKAVWFAQRFSGDEQRLARGKVAKENIIAYNLSRGESEVIVNPEDVRVYRTQVIHRK